MASLATQPSQKININLKEIQKILIDGNNYLCSGRTECRKPRIARISPDNSITISDDPEYQYGAQAQSVYNKCFPTSSDKNDVSCRLCFYKLDDDEKKRKAMLKKPIDKRKGAKSKEGHGKTFESNINECISSYFQDDEEDDDQKIQFLELQKQYVNNIITVFPQQKEFKLPIFQHSFISFLEHPNDPLDVSVRHFYKIDTEFKNENISLEDRKDQQLYPIIKTAMKLPDNYNRRYQLDLEECMGNGINIKYFESKEHEGRWYPKRMDMANYLTWWNDTRKDEDNKISLVELKEIYGDEFNREISFDILPFALMLGCWNEIKDTTTKLEYKCGQGCWIIKFQYQRTNNKCPAVNMLWGDPTKYGMDVKAFKKLLFQLAKTEKQIREEQQKIKNDWLNRWNWPPKDKEKIQNGTKKNGDPRYKTIKRKPKIPDDKYMDETDIIILKLIFRWYGPMKEIDNDKKINPKGMKAGSAFHNFVNYPEYQEKYIEWSNNPNDIYYKEQTQSLTEIVNTIKKAINLAGGLHTLGPKIFSYKGTEIINNEKSRDKIKNKKIKEIFPRDCRAPQGNLTGTNILTFLNEMERQKQAIYIPKMDSLYRLFAPIQYNWIDKVTSKIYSLMELKNLYQQTIPSGGGVDDDELEDLLDIVLYDIPDDNTSEFLSVLDNLNKIEYSLQHKIINPEDNNELQNLNNMKLNIIDINDRLENVEEEVLIHKPFNKIIEICKQDNDNNEHLKDVLNLITEFESLLMNLIIELKNDLPGKTPINIWEGFILSEADDNVIQNSALAYIVDFHLNKFKTIYEKPRMMTRSSVSSETDTGKSSPPPPISTEIETYNFTAYQKLEIYLSKNHQLIIDGNNTYLGFQFWKDVVDEIYNRYYKKKETVEQYIQVIDNEILPDKNDWIMHYDLTEDEKINPCVKIISEFTDIESGTYIPTTLLNNLKNRIPNLDDNKEIWEKIKKYCYLADACIKKCYNEKGEILQHYYVSDSDDDSRNRSSSKDSSSKDSSSKDNKSGFLSSFTGDLRSSAESNNSSNLKNQESIQYTESNTSGQQHRAKRRINTEKMDEEEEDVKRDIIGRLNGMPLERLERVLNSITTNTSPLNLTSDVAKDITISNVFKQNRVRSETLDSAKNAFGEDSPGRRRPRKRSDPRVEMTSDPNIKMMSNFLSDVDPLDPSFMIGYELKEFINFYNLENKEEEIRKKIKNDFKIGELKNLEKKLNDYSQVGDTQQRNITSYILYLKAIKNDSSSEIEDKKGKLKMILKGRTQKYTPAQIQENESKKRDMLVMEMLEKNNKPFTKDGYVVEQNRDRIERLMDDYNIPFEEALTSWVGYPSFNTDNNEFWKGENANMRGGKKRRKKSRKRNKNNKKGGTRKKYKYYFNEYI